MNILLTGATGYLGSRLGAMLLDAGHAVTAIHRNRQEVFPHDARHAGRVDKVYLTETAPGEIFAGRAIDGIIHTATCYGRTGETVADQIRANVVFPVELLSGAMAAGVKFFINTDTILNKLVSPYALTKSQMVEWMEFCSGKLQMVDIKLDHFYGPADKPTKFVAYVLEKLLRGEAHLDLTEGTQQRDFIYIDDVVEVYRCVLDHLAGLPHGQVATFEVGTGTKSSIRHVVETLKALTGAATQLNFGAIPWRKNEMLDYDINTCALRLLGWEPKVGIDEGLARCVAEAKRAATE